MVLEWVAECSWNRWPDVSGMGGRMFMESVAEWVWNTQMVMRVSQGLNLSGNCWHLKTAGKE